MPLIKSTSGQARNKNIAELIKSKYPPKQAEAIAYDVQRKAKGEKPKEKKK